MNRRPLYLGAALTLGTILSCHPARQERPRASAPARAPASTLPEDPHAGQLALARWTEHLEEEERSRQANYDRRRLPEHQALIAVLEQTRASYDRASTKAAATRLQTQFRARLPALRNNLQHIDRWGRSSHLVKDYHALLDLLADEYPKARLAALDGDRATFQRLGAELDSRLTAAHDWLKLAETAEEE